MPTINVNDAYVLNETGAEVDKVTGLFTKNENASTGEKQMARLNIAAGGSNPNLLDNWYFVGGGSQLGDGVFPINQRGQSSYTAAGNNGIDRWGGSYCNIVLNASGLTVTSTGYTNNLYQFVPYKLWDGLVGKTVTLSFDIEAISGSWAIAAHNTAVGTISATGITSVSFVVPSVTDSNKFIGVAGQSGNVITIKAVKLELGTVSTLANDVPPNFAAEFEKCRYYLRYIPLTRYAIAIDGANAYMTMIGMPMRGVPTPSLVTAGGVRDAGGTSTITSATVTGFTYKIPTVQFALSASRSYVVGYIYDTVLCLSAEL